jgi:hypothetical protein
MCLEYNLLSSSEHGSMVQDSKNAAQDRNNSEIIYMCVKAGSMMLMDNSEGAAPQCDMDYGGLGSSPSIYP